MKKSVLFFVAFCMSAFIALNAQTTVTSWVGNTWGKTTADPNWVQNDVRGMYVVPDGTVYTASNWDEGTHECGIYSTNGTFLNALDDTHARTWYCVSVGNAIPIMVIQKMAVTCR
jgi:predicted heme/steroid binding protein